MPLIVTRTARSIIYLLCIGGLLVLNSLIVTVLWNRVFRDPSSSTPELSILEGTGLTAFAYVIVMAIRYGMRTTPSAASRSNLIPDCGNDQVANERVAHLSMEQRAALKHELIHRCGCRETSADS